MRLGALASVYTRDEWEQIGQWAYLSWPRHPTGHTSDQILPEPLQRALPGVCGRVLFVARAGVVVEGVLGAGVDVDLVCDACLLQRLFERGHPGGDAGIVLAVDAEHGGLDVGHILQGTVRS